MNYATFWQRFGAAWIDFFVLLPLIVLQEWLDSQSRTAAIVLIVPMAALYLGYAIYGHGKFGQTIGKHVVRIRVMTTAGERIGWREAWARSSVDLVLTVLACIASFVALTAIADADYYGVGWVKRSEHLSALMPFWFRWVVIATHVWTWSEVVVMLFNKRRRALHDFIAGTVVIAE